MMAVILGSVENRSVFMILLTQLMSTAADTEITRAHRIRLRPNREQEAYFRRACGIRRSAYNWALGEWNRLYELHKQSPESHKKPSWMGLQKQFNAIKRDDRPWITEVSARIPERAIRDVGTAWSNFFKALKCGDRRFRTPRFERKGLRDRFYVHNQELKFHADGRHVCIGSFKKLGWVRCREALRFQGKIQGATIRRLGSHWYLAVQVTMQHASTAHKVGGEIGIDLGIANQVATSDGQLFKLPLERMQQLERQIRRAQKTLSRRWSGKIKKGHADKAIRNDDGQLLPASRRFRHQADRVAKLHQKLANVRLDALHKLSTMLVESYELVAIEDLSLSNMSASAKGSIEKPGRNVRSKAGLNRSLLRAAMRNFRIMLEYKAEAAGGTVLAIDPSFTSQTCSACNHREAGNRPTQSTFKCLECGHSEHADVNAARNILQKAKGPGKMPTHSTVMHTESGRSRGKKPKEKT